MWREIMLILIKITRDTWCFNTFPTKEKPLGGGGLYATSTPLDLSRGSCDCHKNLHEGIGRCTQQDAKFRFFKVYITLILFHIYLIVII